jgi:hypothetical protein
MFSQMYDNVSEHPDAPDDAVLEDDDALDGWFLIQKDKRKAEKSNQNMNTMLGIDPNAQEVFIPAQTPEDIQRIHDMNSVQGKMIKAQRSAAIQKEGVLKEHQLPDRRREIIQAKNGL